MTLAAAEDMALNNMFKGWGGGGTRRNKSLSINKVASENCEKKEKESKDNPLRF